MAVYISLGLQLTARAMEASPELRRSEAGATSTQRSDQGPFPAYVLKHDQGLDEAQSAVALRETIIFDPVSSRYIVFARVDLVRISSNRVSTRRPSTHLWRFLICKVSFWR